MEATSMRSPSSADPSTELAMTVNTFCKEDVKLKEEDTSTSVVPGWRTQEFVKERSDKHNNNWNAMSENQFAMNANHCKLKKLSQAKETSNMGSSRKYKIYDDLNIHLDESGRRKGLQLESYGRGRHESQKKLTRKMVEKDPNKEAEEDVTSDIEEVSKRKKRKADRKVPQITVDKQRANNMKNVLDDFIQLQKKLEVEWRLALEEREKQRKAQEKEWRLTLKKLEDEIALKEQAWKKREDERQAQEEARAEKREKLYSILIKELFLDESVQEQRDGSEVKQHNIHLYN